MIGSRHIEFGASHQCLQVSIREDIAHVEGIPHPEPFTLFLIDQHVFDNYDRKPIPNLLIALSFTFFRLLFYLAFNLRC